MEFTITSPNVMFAMFEETIRAVLPKGYARHIINSAKLNDYKQFSKRVTTYLSCPQKFGVIDYQFDDRFVVDRFSEDFEAPHGKYRVRDQMLSDQCV